jgi:hypothetical protein
MSRDDEASRVPRRAGVLAAASDALGRELTGPEPLRDSDWTVVLRCADEAGPARGPGTVIVKGYPPGLAGENCFAAEAAGLALAGETGLAPELLVADWHSLTMVMADLGRAPSLADALLGVNPDRAARALLDWAEACGRLAVATASREPEFARLYRQYAGREPQESYWAGLERRVSDVAERAAMVGVTPPDGLTAELGEVAAAAAGPSGRVFSPGDICPDNNLLIPAAPGGVRFIDFEAAGYHPVFLDAAYLRMPFSTCWCVFRLPPGLRDAAEARYRAQVVRIWPELADDGTWQRGMRRAVAAWSLHSMGWLLGQALNADISLEPDAVAAPRSRQLMRHRWQVLAGELEAGGEFPAISALARALLAATVGWQAAELPLYPALRRPRG